MSEGASVYRPAVDLVLVSGAKRHSKQFHAAQIAIAS
jgi:hypothetical protein